ncbi:hypothetical protein [Nocardia niigatensis]
MPVTLAKPSDARHGRVSTYTTGGCRCNLCREALRVYTAQRRAARRAELGTVRGRPYATVDLYGNPITHGTASTYSNWGCRCLPCRVAHSHSTAHYRDRNRE